MLRLLEPVAGRRAGRWLTLALAASVCAAACSLPAKEPPPDAPRRMGPEKASVTLAQRSKILTRARVWRAPAVPIEAVDFMQPPAGEGALPPTADVQCRFQLRASSGLTPKFDCLRPGGDVVKVKYGRSNPETRTEVMATRLVAALGFGADRMYPVARVRCEGCPRYPYARLWWLDSVMAALEEFVVFDLPVIERRHPGVPVEAPGVEGWSFHELAYIDPKLGGASRAEVDALRLLAVFLANWDTKYENQRLVCNDGRPPADGEPCAEPFAMMQDVGATFGPHSLDLVSWRARPVWSDAATCAVSMKSMPYAGATFVDVRISEGGRRLLGDPLRRLSQAQIRTLFVAARVAEYEAHLVPEANDLEAWVTAFQTRTRQITERAPCPEEPAVP